MYDDYDDFYEPSEFEERMEELKATLRESVKAEIKQKMERLENENSQLCHIKKNWDAYVREKDEQVQTKLNELEKERSDLKRVRLKELVDEFGVEAWGVKERYDYAAEKCDKCDDKRRLHFLSPNGRECTEECECAKTFTAYDIIPMHLVTIEYKPGLWNGKKRTRLYYTYDGKCEDGDEYTLAHNLYDGEPFETINVWRLVFLDKQKAAEYVQWRLDKNARERELKKQAIKS